MLTSKFNIHSLALVLYLWSKYLCAMCYKTNKKKKSRRLNCLASKINDKKGARALLSRSHLNISFRDIDLFCVTYPGPFFVIKIERAGLWRGGYLSRVAIPIGVNMCGCVCGCVYVFLCS